MAATTPKMNCTTKVAKGVVADATDLYEHLRDTVKWVEGIRSRKGFTRKAAYWYMGKDSKVDAAIMQGLDAVAKYHYAISHVYINYYEDGDMWTPNHSHKGTHQLVISLGTTRTLEIGKRSFPMGNGDVIIFGGSTHGVPKEPSITDGRISIATFMVPIAEPLCVGGCGFYGSPERDGLCSQCFSE